MPDLSISRKDLSAKGDSGLAGDVRQELLTMLQQSADLRVRGVFIAAEHEQLRAILAVALRRLDETAPRGKMQHRTDPTGEDEIVDAVAINADPNDPDVLDAADLFLEGPHVILDAVELDGALEGDDILDALNLPDTADGVLDAVDLGDVDAADALDALNIEDFAGGLDMGSMEELEELELVEFAGDDLVEDIGLDFGGDGSDAAADTGFRFGTSEDA